MADDDYDVIKDWEIIGEPTYRVRAIFSTSSKEEAAEAFKKRLQANNLVGVKIISITHKPPLTGMNAPPPGSPLRQTMEPDMPLHPPDPPKKATGGAGGRKKKGA